MAETVHGSFINQGKQPDPIKPQTLATLENFSPSASISDTPQNRKKSVSPLRMNQKINRNVIGSSLDFRNFTIEEKQRKQQHTVMSKKPSMGKSRIVGFGKRGGDSSRSRDTTPMSKLRGFNRNTGFSKASLASSGNVLVNCTSDMSSRNSRTGSQFLQIRKQKTKKYVKDPELDSLPFNDKSFEKAIGKI